MTASMKDSLREEPGVRSHIQSKMPTKCEIRYE